MDIGNVALVGVPAVILIPLIIEAAKRFFGLPDTAAPWLTLALSIAAAAIAQLVDSFPAITPYVASAISAIVLFLTVTGLYHTTKNSVNTFKRVLGSKK